MTREEFEGKWDPGNEKVRSKWGSLTRAERSAFAGRRQKRDAELLEHPGISAEEAANAPAAPRVFLRRPADLR